MLAWSIAAAWGVAALLAARWRSPSTVLFLVGGAIVALFAPVPHGLTVGITSFAALSAVRYPRVHAQYMAATGAAKRRLQWFGWGVAVSALAAITLSMFHLLVDWPRSLGGSVALATLGVPLGVAVGVYERSLAFIDRLLARTFAVVGLLTVVLATYVLVVLGLGRPPEGHERSLLVLSMLAGGVAAVAYGPARRAIDGVSNRLVYGREHVPEKAARQFGANLSRAVPIDELLLQLAESLRDSHRLHSAEVWSATGTGLELAASRPARPGTRIDLSTAERKVLANAGVAGPAWADVWLPKLMQGRANAPLRVAPITHNAELFGVIVVDRAAGDDDFSADEESLLADLARQVGLALRNVRLDSALQQSLDELQQQADELQASRARIVATADAERRKIERDLHDGAQSNLSAILVKLSLARETVEAGGTDAVDAIAAISDDVRESVQELRRLAHGIYPPILRESGLAAALANAANRAALPTEVAAAGLDRSPQDVEAAIYFCCLEAIQNAGKHAGDRSSITVRVWQEEGALRFSVTDDGAGFDVATRATGAGFVNMRDRLGAIGGDLTVASEAGQGTTVAGRIPIVSNL